MMLKCDATVLCKIFSENLRNQNRKTFISVFAYFLVFMPKVYFSGGDWAQGCFTM